MRARVIYVRIQISSLNAQITYSDERVMFMMLKVKCDSGTFSMTEHN